MSDKLKEALEWCLKYGVKAVDFSPGYWAQGGYDGREAYPPPHLAEVLSQARGDVPLPRFTED